MDSSTYCMFFIFVAVIVGVFYIDAKMSDSKKPLIRAEIGRNGGKVIEISRNFFGGSKGIYAFKVVFEDQSGKKHETACMVSSSIVSSSGKELFWSRTPAELMNGAQIANAPVVFNHVGNEHVEPTTKSSKEQIIDDLNAENLRLRRELEQLRDSGGNID